MITIVHLSLRLRCTKKELIYGFFKPHIPYKFRIWEYIHITILTLYISQSCKNKECCAKTTLDFVEMHTDSLDPYLIGIVVWRVFGLNSLNLEVYLNTPAIVCIRIYRQVIYNGWSNDVHVRWMILVKTIYYQGRFELRWISANRRVVLSYL